MRWLLDWSSDVFSSDLVKPVNIDGVEPTPENIVAGDYTVARPFNYMSNEDEPLSELAQAFLDFVLSKEGQDVVEEQGRSEERRVGRGCRGGLAMLEGTL